MSIQHSLFDHGMEDRFTDPDIVSEASVDLGIAIRNSTFESIKDELPDRRREILELILMHPSGISSKGISVKHLNGRALHTFSGRITELKDMGLVETCGVEYYPDHNGNMRAYTKLRVKG